MADKSLNRKIVKLVIVLLVASVLCVACAPSPRQFNSEDWKSGGTSVHGSMTEDLKSRKLLEGKAKPEVEQMLGKPDESGKDWLGFNVHTTARCNYWRCMLEINFDEKTGKVKFVGVSD